MITQGQGKLHLQVYQILNADMDNCKTIEVKLL